jgi:Fe-S cluster biogenesis protein NfuA/nitrite reductase/ring-hydroxylating ferredoxin subunit
MDDRQARECVARIEALLEEVEGLPAAVELVQALLDLYGEGLGRIVASDPALVARLDGDEVVTHLLLLHGLHPVPLEERVVGALDEVRPYLASHGGGVELLGVEEGVVRLRLQGSCDGCPSSTATLKLAIEDAIHKAAPDVEGVVAEGAPRPAPGLLQIEVPDVMRSWSDAGAIGDLPADAPKVGSAGGRELLFVRLGKAAYAYGSVCASCGAELSGAVLDGAVLTCGACRTDFDVRRAGRRVDGEDGHLDPVPLLVGDDGRMRVAVS